MHYGSLNIQWVTQNYHQERSTQSRIQRKTCTEVQLTQFTQEWQECINWKLILLPVHYLCTFLPLSCSLSHLLSQLVNKVLANPVVPQLRLTKTLLSSPLRDFDPIVSLRVRAHVRIVYKSRDSNSHAVCSAFLARLSFVFRQSRPAFDRRGRPLTTQ